MAFIIDGHEDLATNMITFGRDYRRSAAETRAREVGTSTPGLNGDTLLGWEDYQRGKVALIFATLFSSPEKYRLDGWDITTFSNPAEAHSICLRQLDAYKKLAENDPEMYSLVMSSRDLGSVLEPWLEEPPAFPHTTHPVGLMILMEGAEGLKEPEEVEEWWHAGVRMIGPVWSGTRWCGGTREPGRFTPEGFQLLDHMANTGFILDISHMSPESALQALDYYPGRIAASHANAISLIHGSTSPVFQNRHLTDETIRLLVGRNGVIGVLPMIPMLVANWKSGDPRSAATLDTVFAQIDHICQLAGDTRHAALGTDFDGGFGLQSAPADFDTIADLQELDPIFRKNGYSDSDITAILGNNWKRFLEESLP